VAAMTTRIVQYLNYFLAVCTIASSCAYLFYLNSHHMVRAWSGINSLLLGLFMASCAVREQAKGGRWSIALFAVASLLNVAGALLFFL
jgi:hypothetical protein